MPVEIPLKRKYLEVLNGNFRSPATTGTAKKKPVEKTVRDRALAEANRRRASWVMHLQANGKKRMKRPD
jgi:hypothetical protein